MSDFLEDIKITDWIITPNNRLSQFLQQRYASLQSSAVFALPRFLPYDTLLLTLFEQLQNQTTRNDHQHPLLLNGYQFQILVSGILKRSSQINHNETLVQRVIDSYQRCQGWEIPIELSLFSYHHQSEMFYQWTQDIERELCNIDAICFPQLAHYLMQHTVCLKDINLCWYGFDDFSPQQRSMQSWLEACQASNCFFDVEAKSTPLQVYAAKNEQDEQQQWLEWLLNHEGSGKKLGVILPDLTIQSALVSRLMTRHFPSEAFNISLGQSLATYPLAMHALCFLTLSHEVKLDNRTMKILLHSPFIGESQAELHSRSLLLNDQALMQHRQLSLNAFIQRGYSKAPLLSKRLKSVSSYPDAASPFEWANHFDTRLQQLGFPGEAALNSATYQCYQRFNKALNDFRSLSVVRPSLSRDEAVQLLHTLLQQIIFQPQASASAYIHISGLLEASGITYDGLWIAGLNDLTLPQALQYSPFIPVPLQQEKNMPHASLEREQRLAQTMIQRFQKSTSQLLCSYPSLIGEQPCLASPLLTQASVYHPKQRPEPAKAQRERWEETYLIPLQDNEPIHGGSGVLANQAKCPFRALAAHRLHCDNLSHEQDGLEKREQGILIHEIMEKLWQKIQSQEVLLQLSPTQEYQLIEQVCDAALKPYQQDDNDTLLEYSLAVERARLCQLAKASLALDKRRPPFKICAIETESTYSIGEHRLRIKIDRLDIESTGKKWLIDYKSSIPRIPWDKERPEDPQLILYAMHDTDISTISYLQLKSGDIKYKGIAHQKIEVEGITAPKKGLSWDHYQTTWARALQTLSDEFSQGHCPPEPLRSEVCQHCDFSSLCRYTMRETEELL